MQCGPKDLKSIVVIESPVALRGVLCFTLGAR